MNFELYLYYHVIESIKQDIIGNPRLVHAVNTGARTYVFLSKTQITFPMTV